MTLPRRRRAVRLLALILVLGGSAGFQGSAASDQVRSGGRALARPNVRGDAQPIAPVLSAKEQDVLELAAQLPISLLGRNGAPHRLAAVLGLEDTGVARSLLTSRLGMTPAAFDATGDGDALAAVFGGGEVGVWDTRTGELTLELALASQSRDLGGPFDTIQLVDGLGLVAVSSLRPGRTCLYEYRSAPGLQYVGEIGGRLVAFGRVRSGRFVFVSLKEGSVLVWGIRATPGGAAGWNEFESMELLQSIAVGELSYRPPVTGRLDQDVLAVGVGSHPRDVLLVDLAEGVVRQAISMDATVATIALAEDAATLFVADYDNRLRAFDLRSGTAQWVVSAGEPDWSYAWFAMPILLAPDGRRMVVALMTAEVFVIDSRSGWVVQRVELSGADGPVRQLAWLRSDSALVVLSDAPEVVRVE